MNLNLLLVVNPTAGSVDLDDVVSKAKKWSAKRQYKLSIFETTGNNDRSKIEELLNTTKFSRVLVAGGDGTINMVASVLVAKDIILAILACGSANGLATSLQLPNDLEQQIKVALGDNYIEMDALYINDRLCIHISDLGINAELIYNFETTKSKGILGYIIQTIPTLFKSDYPYTFQIKLNGVVKKIKGVLLAFANASKYGTGATINPEGKVNDGVFEVIIFKRLNIIDIIKTFFKASALQQHTVEIFQTNAVSVMCKKPIALQVDGEYVGEYYDVSATIKAASLKIALP